MLQGCPASAFLFNLAPDPFLVRFETALASKQAGILRACADDIGAALRALKYLLLLKPIFDDAARLAGLHLKPAKCNIIVCVPLSQELKDSIHMWIKKMMPAWSDFQVGSSAKLLGFYLGPTAGAKQLLTPFQKFAESVQATSS